MDVLTAARQRIKWTLETFPKVCVSFSGGKDSSVMLHLAMDEAKLQNRRIAVLFIDLEAQYEMTIKHIESMFEQYAEWIEPYWVALPLHMRNAVSQYEPQWVCWEKSREKDWVRKPPAMAITDESYFPFFKPAMEFEEFVEEFSWWYSQNQLTAQLVGIRTDESLNRWRAMIGHKKTTFEGVKFTTYKGKAAYNVYPIYDWRTQDIWIYNGKTGVEYNRLYDRMYQAGLSIHQQRICQPYGDDQRKGLWLFHLIEPQTWSKIVARVNGANQGALYANDSGNILGNIKVTKPDGHTWESFAMLLLGSMPDKTAEHYKDKISVFLKWYQNKGIDPIPDDGPLEKSEPSWKRICKTLLKNDYWCKGLSFTQTNSQAYEKYKSLMKRRREEWKLI